MTDSRLREALASLHQIGLAINQLDSDDLASLKTVLGMIVQSATRAVAGASSIIFTYDESKAAFDRDSLVTSVDGSGALTGSAPLSGSGVPLPDPPRADGMGARAVARRQRVLSYEESDLDGSPAREKLGAQAIVCYPLIIGKEVLGVLYVYLREQRSFNELELLILDNIANLTAMTLSLARQFALAQTEQARRDRELRRLRRAGMVISSRSNLKGTLEAILSVAMEITDAIYGIFRLVDPSGKNLITQAISGVGLGRPAVETLPIDGGSVMGTVAMRREPVVIPDLADEPWRSIYYPFDLELQMRSELAVPLIGASGRLEGVLNLESPQVNAFDKQDRYILQILATQAVIAIQEARLLDALQEISSLLPRLSPHLIHQTLVERACDLLNLPFGLLWLLEKDHLLLQAASDPSLAGLRLPLEQTLAGQAVREGKPVILRAGGGDYPDLPQFGERASALIVPLVVSPESAPIGAFSVHTAPGDARDFNQADWDKKVLDIFGRYAALAVQLAAQQEALRVAQDQRAMTEAFAAIGDIAANLLHRLNNKVGTIPVRVEGIQDKCQAALQADPYLEKNLEAIETSATEAMEAVRESLFHLHPIQLAPVSVAASVREALAASRLPESIEVVFEGLDQLPAVQAGTRRLVLVFSNLLENAADAMGGSGRIEISGRLQGEWVEVAVRDNGPGIPGELQERIFEFNYSSRASAQPGKLGFGLWWVKSLMARFGGSVTVESDGQHGTCFLLSLPRAAENHT